MMAKKIIRKRLGVKELRTEKKKRQDEKNLKDRGVYTDTRGTSSNQLSIDAAGSQQSGFR